jgi:hypothetical protein
MDNIIERLLALKSGSAFNRQIKRTPVNPDGKAAVELIIALETELNRAQDMIDRLIGGQKKEPCSRA